MLALKVLQTHIAATPQIGIDHDKAGNRPPSRCRYGEEAGRVGVSELIRRIENGIGWTRCARRR